MSHAIDPKQARWWLALVRTPGLGAAGLRALLERMPEPEAIFRASRSEWQAAGLDARACEALAAPDWEALDPRLEQDQAWLAQPDAHLLTLTDPRYPALLAEIPDPPPVLFVRGDPAALNHPQLAVVGSRNPTPSGHETARDFARYLAAVGLGITSGLALGIDAMSHEGALAGGGVTVAVVGTGLDRVYPARHRDLAHRITVHGALVSEFPLGMPPLPGNFPRRNRIISGLSLGTLVVEAALQSGSLITARLAAEQGREVFAIPGSIHNPLSRGCHALIRQGAKLVETGGDIIEELGALYDFAATAVPGDAVGTQMTGEVTAGPDLLPGLDADYQRVLAGVDRGPTPVDVVVQRSGLTPDAVCSMLLVLELHGLIVSTTGGYYAQVS